MLFTNAQMAYRELLCLKFQKVARIFLFLSFLGFACVSQAQVVIVLDDLALTAQEGPDGSQIEAISSVSQPAQQNLFDLSPNPAVNYVVLSLDNGITLQQIIVTNANGEIVLQTRQSVGEIYAADIIPGEYEFTIYTDQGIETQQFYVVTGE